MAGAANSVPLDPLAVVLELEIGFEVDANFDERRSSAA
jgi:hypothetical protein